MSDQSQHRRRFEEDGYLLLPGLLHSSNFQGLMARVDEAVDRRTRTLYDEGMISNLHENESLEHRWQRVFEDMGGTQSRRSWDEDVISEDLYGLMRQPALLDVLEQLIGPEIIATGLIALRPKVPQDKRTTVLWHQDSHYFGRDSSDKRIITVWLPLVDADAENGCMQVIPGSHSWGYVEAEIDPEHNAYRPLEDPEQRGPSTTCEMQVGDVLIFGNLTLHRSLPNVSDHVRWSIDFRYHAPGLHFERESEYIPGFLARSRSNPESIDSWPTWHQRYKDSGITTE
jgi:ectoine hydroxylase-related dioxygenase (phytanoyl-CoA dioxygenase family)